MFEISKKLHWGQFKPKEVNLKRLVREVMPNTVKIGTCQLADCSDTWTFINWQFYFKLSVYIWAKGK